MWLSDVLRCMKFKCNFTICDTFYFYDGAVYSMELEVYMVSSTTGTVMYKIYTHELPD